MTQDRIIFFASGDFAIDTFTSFIDSGYNVVGLVTSNDSVTLHDKRLSEIAQRFGVPTYKVKSGALSDDTFLLDWLMRHPAELFCVISFKKLPKNVYELAKKCAFNIHASLLPDLAGSSPINWAIRSGRNETGLTAFVLNERIDAGDIIANQRVEIKEGEKFTTLFSKLSELCIDFTRFVVDEALQRKNWKKYLVSQPQYLYQDFFLPKYRSDVYLKPTWALDTPHGFVNYVNSINHIGVPCIFRITKENGDTQDIKAKIYSVEQCDDEDKEKTNWTDVTATSDGKNFVKLCFPVVLNECVLIKELQLVGKKVMDVKTFLGGFRYFREGNCKVDIIPVSSYE